MRRVDQAKLLSGSARDDRGNALACFDFVAIREAARGKSELRAYLDDESSHPSRDFGTLWIGIGSFLVLLIINFTMYWVLFGILRWPYFTTGSMLLAIAGVVVASLAASAINSPMNRMVRNAIARRRAAMISRMAIRHGICGGCGYSLDTLEREPDGCTVCPECGAAWKDVPANSRDDITP